MRLRDILESIPEVQGSVPPEAEVRGIAYDSRQVRSGFLFVAIKGEKTDGNLFIRQAAERGAVAVASEEDAGGLGVAALRVADARRFLARASQVFFRHPSDRLQLVGITGTNGKTTTSYLLESIFRCAGLLSCVVGTIGMRIGDRQFPSGHTTPESSDLESFLAEAASDGCTHGAVEVSSHALAQRRVFGIRFPVAVFTNLTPEHLDFHRDMESYYQAKKLLFLPHGENGVETAIINVDDPYGRRLKDETKCRVLSCGFEGNADIRVLHWHGRIDGTNLLVATPREEVPIRTHLVGRPNVYNILSATGAALGLGIPPDVIRRGIEALEGVPGRMELVRAGQLFTVIVDYAHSPDALQKLLETVSSLPRRRLLTVFGCGGDRDRTKRPVMGEIAARWSDFVFATSDNPRTEDPLAILAEIEPGLRNASSAYRIVPDRREALAAVLAMAERGDVVVIAGKGHENYQIIGGQTLPFDDRVVAKELILDLLDQGAQNSSELHQ
jgi:UDP-N-acetylmuramoyl-L-alanyl-D-glutamate--2,6-diaminopimelate ligase